MDEDSFQLLAKTAKILREAARYYVREDTKTAQKARELVLKQTPGRQPFHASIHGALCALQQLLEENRITHGADKARAAANRTMDTFEALTRAKDDKSGLQYESESTFSGLRALQIAYNAEKRSRWRPKSLGFRKYLYCPSAEMRKRLKEDVEACCDALRVGSDEHCSADVLSEVETIREWSVPSSIFDNAVRVRNVLLRHWNCHCGKEHRRVKLAFTNLPKETGDALNNDIIGCYRIYWPSEEGSGHEDCMPLLHLLDTAPRSRAANTNGPPNLKKGNVLFVEPDKQNTLRNLTCRTASKSFSTICDAVNSHNGDCLVRANEDTLCSFALASDALFGNGRPLRSLRTLLVPGATWRKQDITPRQRVLMAVALAYAYLHLSDTDWWPRREVVPDFWFMENATHSGLEAGLPFLSFHVNAAGNSKSTSMAGLINPVRPSLPAFGKMLLEIYKGTPLKWGDELEEAVAECELDYVGGYWLCAANACLGKENALKDEGVLQDSARLRPIFVLKVIKSLQWLLEKCVGKSRELVFPAPVPVAPCADANTQRSSDTSNSKTRCIHSSAHSLSPVKEVRTFVREEDGDGGVLCPEGEDMDGHGTHAASVFLDIDPFSELYIAKVFEGRGQKQGSSMQKTLHLGVARAITYAVEVWKVQVISLSFGFEYQVDIIRDAILTAQRSKVIVLAAASNNGGNKPLSWPARQEAVFDIYATNGYGNTYERNPTPRRRDDNFAVLGSCVKGWWNSGGQVIRSGTSTATPIAAGLASLTIHFLRQQRASYGTKQHPDEDLEELCRRISTYSGMRRIFRRMVSPDTDDRDGYCYVEPWLLFDRSLSRDTICEIIIAELRQV